MRLTAEQWFKEFKSPFREMLLDNLHKYRLDKPTDTYMLASQAVMYSFCWRFTPQGNSYWGNIHTKLEHDEAIMRAYLREKAKCDSALKEVKSTDYRPEATPVPIDDPVDSIEFNDEDKVELLSLGMIKM